jgi:hypothetical protein
MQRNRNSLTESKKLSKQLFSFDDNGFIQYSNEISKLKDTTLHRFPLLHVIKPLSYYDSLIPHKLEPEYTTRRDNSGMLIFSKFSADPIETYFTTRYFEKPIKTLLEDGIKNSNSIVLLGALGIYSIQHTIDWLSDNKFKGTLKIYEKSPIAYTIYKKYQKLGFLKSDFSIEIIEKDVININEPFDIALSDILGAYLLNNEYKSFVNMIETNLKTSGLWLTRELVEPQGYPQGKDRNVGSSADFVKKSWELINNSEIFEKEVPLEQVEYHLENVFSSNKNRKSCSRSTLDEYFDKTTQLKHLANITTSSETELSRSAQRIFNVSLFQKP